MDIGTLGGSSSFVADINDRGDVVGFSTTASGEDHAFVWQPQTQVMLDLETLRGTTSAATSINGRGQVAGYSTDGTGHFHAFVPDRFGEFPGNLDPGALGATLAAEAGLGVLAVIAVDRRLGGVEHGFDERPPQVLRAFLASFPRRS